MTEFEPELGQMLFGQPCKSFEVPDIMEAALRFIDHELERVIWNTTRKEYVSPFGNTGEQFECDEFKVHAYSWSDEEQPWNFKWKDVEISWYKWFGRGASSNINITPDMASSILLSCLEALKTYEEKFNDEVKG